jgi:glucose uptake protein GlcU
MKSKIYNISSIIIISIGIIISKKHENQNKKHEKQENKKIKNEFILYCK